MVEAAEYKEVKEMEYVGIREIFNGEGYVKCELYLNGDGGYFTLGGASEQKERVIFNVEEKRFEVEGSAKR